MSAADCQLTEDQFQCSMCLDVFHEPVTTSCGHNFCKSCINLHWETNIPCHCPSCGKTFYTRPELQVNTLISEVVAQIRQSAQIRQMIQKRRLKIEELKQSVELSEEAAARQISEVQVFTALTESVKRSCEEFIDCINHKKRKTEQQAEEFIQELEQEISELQNRSIDDQPNFSCLNATLLNKDWSQVIVRPPSYEGTVVRVVTELEQTLDQQIKKLLGETDLKRVQQSAVDVTLDPNTAHPNLVLSDDEKEVKDGDLRKMLPDNPERFDSCTSVLAKQSFSSGRFYYEVQVKGKTDWDLGVARESVKRKGENIVNPNEGYWIIRLKNIRKYQALAVSQVPLSLKSVPEKVGVFVDYDEGLVSFYDVGAAALIYSFTGCAFTGRLHPYFNPFYQKKRKNAAPLMITPVNQS